MSLWLQRWAGPKGGKFQALPEDVCLLKAYGWYIFSMIR